MSRQDSGPWNAGESKQDRFKPYELLSIFPVSPKDMDLKKVPWYGGHNTAQGSPMSMLDMVQLSSRLTVTCEG